ITARYLADQMRAAPRDLPVEPQRGGFGWTAQALGLDEAARFVLGLALLVGFDGAAGPVIAGCLGDATKLLPTLALAQRLWDRPEEVLALADPRHALWRIGLLQAAGHAGAPVDWDTPFSCPPLIARRLAAPQTPLPDALRALEAAMAVEGLDIALVAGRL